MGDRTADFFDRLHRRGHEPLLGSAAGRVRFDVVDDGQTRRWLVAVDKGDVSVSDAAGDASGADCTVRAQKAFFDRMCSGQENAMSAVLRGAVECSGDVELLLAIQRLFPGPQQYPLGEGRGR